MDRKYTSNTLPTQLIEYLSNTGETARFRLRAVLTHNDDDWRLLCCIVEPQHRDAGATAKVSTRRYESAMLYEDELSPTQCLEFAKELANGRVQLGDVALMKERESPWSTELVPISNDYMQSAGRVVGLSFNQSGIYSHVAPLLSPTEPYYPDIEDAARDWMPFPVYHGRSDSRNGQIIFLLPEKRAFISEAEISDEGTLEVTVKGTLVGDIPLIVKGACWEGTTIHHFDAAVEDSACRIPMPTNIDRIEYYLIAHDGTVFDFHREERHSGASRGKKILGPKQNSLGELIQNALHEGEGQRIEFKPFVAPDQPLGTSSDKSKLREIVTTVVAFANTQGGHVYIGVDDDCNPLGIERKLACWGKGPTNEANADRYIGMLKSKIKSSVQGEVDLRLSWTSFNGALIVIIEVPSAMEKPVAVQQDAYLYARTGASNRKVPPDLWRSVLDTQSSGALSASFSHH